MKWIGKQLCRGLGCKYCFHFWDLLVRKPIFSTTPIAVLLTLPCPRLLELVNRHFIDLKKLKSQVKLFKTAVLYWFNQINRKSEYSFISYDVINFNPATSTAVKFRIRFGETYDIITDVEKEIINHSKDGARNHHLVALGNNGELRRCGIL